MSHTRITYRGSKLFVNDHQIDRATAFGSTTGLTKEDIFELGNAGLVEVVDDIPNVDITLDSNDYGSIKTIALLAGKDPDTATYVDLSEDMEYARSDIYVLIAPQVGGDIVRSQYIENAFVTSVNLAYSVDGNFTESYSLAADNKTWFLNDAAEIGTKTVTAVAGIGDEVEATVVVNEATKLWKALAVYNKDGVKVPDDEWTQAEPTGNTIVVEIESDLVSAGEDVTIRFAGNGGASVWTPNTTDQPALRKGQIEIFLLSDVQHTGGDITSAVEVKQLRLQNVSFDASLDREDLPELGSSRFYDRPMNFPLNINVSLELIDSDLNMFAKLVGKDASSANELRIDDFRNDIGVRVKLYKERDIDKDERDPIKVIDVPYLIPTDESWNVSTEANASQTFSFRTHELRIHDGS